MGEYVLGPIFDEAGNDHATMFYLHSGGSVVTIIHSVYYDYAVDIVTKLNALEDINPESVPDMVEALKAVADWLSRMDCKTYSDDDESLLREWSMPHHHAELVKAALSKAGVK